MHRIWWFVCQYLHSLWRQSFVLVVIVWIDHVLDQTSAVANIPHVVTVPWVNAFDLRVAEVCNFANLLMTFPGVTEEDIGLMQVIVEDLLAVDVLHGCNNILRRNESERERKMSG